MRLIVEPDAEAVARKGAHLVADFLAGNPEAVFAFPTGRTPLDMYDELVQKHRRGDSNWARVRLFSLDEYVGVPPTSPLSFHCYLWTHLASHVNICRENVHLHTSSPTDLTCRQYEENIREAGGIDLLVAGVGGNGHIAFNEPGSPFDSRTRIVDLSEHTLETMRATFGQQQLPRRAVTLGIGTILEVKRILLLAAGESKKAAVRGLIQGEVSQANPVSALWHHEDLTVILDAAAGGN